jgi:hypothetical protein
MSESVARKRELLSTLVFLPQIAAGLCQASRGNSLQTDQSAASPLCGPLPEGYNPCAGKMQAVGQNLPVRKVDTSAEIYKNDGAEK